MAKELRCPYCKLYTNTYKNQLQFEELSDGSFIMNCTNQNCGKKFKFEYYNGKYKEFKLPCMNGGKHHFQQINNTEIHKCIYCNMEIKISKKKSYE